MREKLRTWVFMVRLRAAATWLNFWMWFATRLWVFLLYFEALLAWWRGKIPSFWHVGPAVAARVKMATDRVLPQKPLTKGELKVMEKAVRKRARQLERLEKGRAKRASLTAPVASATLQDPKEEEGQ